MNWVYFTNICASILLAAPIAAILLTRMSLYKTFPLLLLYYSGTFLYSLMAGDFINVAPTVKYYTGITVNLLDGPLMLGFLCCMAHNHKEKELLKKTAFALFVFVAITILLVGYNLTAIKIVLGPSIVLVFTFGFRFFNYYSKIGIRKTGGAPGKTLIAAALIFAYSSYALIYVFYYLLQTRDVYDAYLVYALSTFFSAGLMAFGIYYESKRIRRIEEVKTMRKELATIYAEEEKNAPRIRRPRTLDELFGFDPSEVIPGFRN